MLVLRRFIMIFALYGFSFFNFFALPVTLISTPEIAQAELPWETPLCSLQKSLVGKTAKAIAMIGLFVAGGLLVFGGELSDFGRRITWMCLAISVMLMGTQFLSLFGTSTDCQ
jgi:type IV secretion system protein TrbC